MKRFLVLAALGCTLALALAGCDYGYDEGEDPGLLDESWGTEQFGLRVDDESAETERYDAPPLIPSAPGAAVSVGYVQSQGAMPASLPVQHPDPKPWKK